MNIRRIASALAAVVLAGGLIAATGEAAFADITPVNGGIYELYVPFFNTNAAKCLDVPHGDPTPGLGLVVFHCHGSDAQGANQLWETIFDGTGWLVMNRATGRCLSANLGAGTQVVQDFCVASLPGQIWNFAINSGINTVVGVSNARTGLCLATENSSGGDGTKVVLAPCIFANFSDPTWIRQNWVLA
jgi:hypothetical protein